MRTVAAIKAAFILISSSIGEIVHVVFYIAFSDSTSLSDL